MRIYRLGRNRPVGNRPSTMYIPILFPNFKEEAPTLAAIEHLKPDRKIQTRIQVPKRYHIRYKKDISENFCDLEPITIRALHCPIKIAHII